MRVTVARRIFIDSIRAVDSGFLDPEAPKKLIVVLFPPADAFPDVHDLNLVKKASLMMG